MSTTASEASIREIADFLQTRKYTNKRAVIFLGSRTSGMLENMILYEGIRQYSIRTFENLPPMEKFGECFIVLNKIFNKVERHQILIDASKAIPLRDEDKYLVEMMQKGFFDVIISTCIDNSLENACVQANMEEKRDFRAFDLRDDASADIINYKARHPIILRVFGDLGSRTMEHEFDLSTHPDVKSYLENKLAGDILMVGYDPIWDQTIESIFPQQGGNIYYVNEDHLTLNTPMNEAFQQRKSCYYISNYGSYRNFMDELRWHLSLPWSPPLPSQSTAVRQVGTKVFISYSHKDKKYLTELLAYLKPYEDAGIVDVWSDERIVAGKDWREEIRKALVDAKVAILLISQNFLISKFIGEIELPHLLAAAEAGGVKIIPVNLRPSTVADSPLNRLQAVNSPTRTLDRMGKSQREEIWVYVANLVKNT